jgi:hypothetical protein
MRLRLGVVALLLAVAGCSGTDSDKTPAPTGSATSPAVVATYAASVTATVDTAQSGCNEKANGKGDCWLPLYSKPGLKGDVLNKGGVCTDDTQAKCWPQPGDQIKTVCQVTVAGVTYYGAVIPGDRRVSKPAEEVRGFAEARFFRLQGQASSLGLCKFD